MTDKQSDVLLDTIGQFMKCFVLIGFDDNGDANGFSRTNNPMEQHALRRLLSDIASGECADMLLPTTADGSKTKAQGEGDDGE